MLASAVLLALFVDGFTYWCAQGLLLPESDNIPQSELSFLQDFYDSTNGQYWTRNRTNGNPWEFAPSANPCSENWEGITCISELNITHVTKLVLPFFNLSGSIPDNINELSYLSDFNLRNNNLTGTIPSTIGELSHLKFFVLFSNKMTGTLPDIIGKVQTLEEFDIGINQFHGTIPSSFGELSNLFYLYAHGNFLSGHIPESLGNANNLLVLQLESNKFSGTIPRSFGNLTKINELVLYDNYMTGPLPNNWMDMKHVQSIAWGQNLFVGTLPSYLCELTTLKYFYLNNNYLTGTIPSDVGNFALMKEMLLYTNYLSGTLPATLHKMESMAYLSLDQNKFVGILSGAFNASSQKGLFFLTLNNNEFTGPIPDELYQLPALEVLIMSQNCLELSLPALICESQRLTKLSLDGLSTASSCRRLLLPGLFKTYVPKDTRHAQLPSCMFEMPNLQTLHLSAIGLEGKLPENITLSPSLIDLSLSHNSLEGSIPHNFQAHAWISLALSYNKFRGVMDSSLAMNSTSGAVSTTTLFLSNNRLSGGIPASVRNIANVSILGSNLLHCDVEATELPPHDNGRKIYQCGSTSFEVPYYIWLGITVVVAMLFASANRFRKFWDRSAAFSRNLTYMRMWLTVSSGTYGQWKDKIKSVAIVSRVCELLCRTALWCLAYIMVVLLPVYIACSFYYSTMTYRYAYTLSAAYLSGTVPASIMCVALVGLPVLLVIVYVRHLPSYTVEEMKIRLDSRSSRNLSSTSLQDNKLSLAAKISNTFVYLTFGLANLVVVISVNYAYIYVVDYQSNNILLISQVCIAFFKLVWSGSGIRALERMAMKYLVLNDLDVSSAAVETKFILLQILLSLLNNIVIPCVVVAVVSESCFYYVFVPAPRVITTVPNGVCTSVNVEHCSQATIGTTYLSFDPPYQYDYQCSSSIITIYAPAYVTLCIMATFGVPIIEMLARHWHSATHPQSYLHRTIDFMLPRILKPIDVLNEEELQVQSWRYFNVNQLLVGLINLLGLLLTFGAVFPPLAVALASTLIAVTYFAKLKLGRFMCNAITARRINYLELIEAECRRAGAVTVLYRSAWMLVVFSCLFYTLFIFDTLGDDVGLGKALLVFLVLPLMPIVIYSVYSFLDVLINKTGADAAARAIQDAVVVEMSVLGHSSASAPEVGNKDAATFNALLFSVKSDDEI